MLRATIKTQRRYLIGVRTWNHIWPHIPGRKFRMLLSCIKGSARQEIVLLQPEGLAFESYKTGEFFTELLK